MYSITFKGRKDTQDGQVGNGFLQNRLHPSKTTRSSRTANSSRASATPACINNCAPRSRNFLLEYIIYLERRGIENGNRAGLRQFLRMFRALFIDLLDKYRGKGIDNYVLPVYTEKHLTDRQKVGRRNSISALVSQTLDKACEILGIDEKMT